MHVIFAEGSGRNLMQFMLEEDEVKIIWSRGREYLSVAPALKKDESTSLNVYVD